MVVCEKACHKKYYARNREQILARQKRYSRTENAEILKLRRKRWYENNRERLASSQRAYCQQKQRTHQKLPKTTL